MLIPVKNLLDRLRHPRSRADELAALRRKLAEPAQGDEALAREVVRLKIALAEAIGDVRSCSGCALPGDRWAGGHCCSSRTENLFTDEEIRALHLAGTRDLTAPRSDHAGCAFRGPEGCSLAVADRPVLCVRYLCRELETEIAERGDLATVKALAAALVRAMRELQSDSRNATRSESRPL